jgi:hypothetical protein
VRGADRERGGGLRTTQRTPCERQSGARRRAERVSWCEARRRAERVSWCENGSKGKRRRRMGRDVDLSATSAVHLP